MLYPCDQCGQEVEFDTIVGRLCPQCREHSAVGVSENEIKPRSNAHKIAYASFGILGVISLYISYLTFGAVGGAGGHIPPRAIGFLIIIPLGIPIFLAVIFGPCLSLFAGWDDGYLMFLTGLSFLLVVGSFVVSVSTLSWVYLAYGLSCLTIGTKWIMKMNVGGTSNNSQY